MALDVNNVVSVTVNISPKAASTRGFGQCLIIGTSKVIPKEERIRYYSSLTELGSDFTVDTDEYKIVGSQEADPFESKISNESPIAKALLGHKVGDIVSVESPNGSYEIKVVAIG